MDAIDRAIYQGWHVSENSKLNNQTWREFEEMSQDKAVVLFGVGNGADFYFYKYGPDAAVDVIVDNNRNIQGINAEQIISEKISTEQIKISGIAVLDSYDANEIVVLIASLKYYAEIAVQLEQMGIVNYFAILPMEANQRKMDGAAEQEDRLQVYVQESCIKEINPQKIVFLTMCDFAGHGKEIAKQLLKIRRDLDIVWIVQNMHIEVPEGIRLVYQKNKRNCVYEMETAKIWICDTGIPDFFIKRKGQIYIQVKHWASITLKSFGFDLAKFRNDKSLIAFSEHDSRMIDYMITGSRFDTETCRRGFNFYGEFCEAGSPRSDILFHSEEFREKIFNKYHISKDSRLLLYAPTFRSKQRDKYVPEAANVTLKFDKVKQALEKRFGGQWIILLRLHPVVAQASAQIERPEFVLDVSGYNDSEELVAASDAMITDYSSIMFELAFIKKPVFLFAEDRKEYINEERELLIAYDSLPFPVSESNDELAEQIVKFDEKQYVQKVTQFLDLYGVHEDGHASERAAGFILNLIDRGVCEDGSSTN